VRYPPPRTAFILKYRRLKSPEAPDEEPTVQLEKIVKLECNININTNYMSQGINSVRSMLLHLHDTV